jgi:hypothetical protein
MDLLAGNPVPLAPAENMRCRCQFGVQCGRLATSEDLLCDWCRNVGGEAGHVRFCGNYLPSAFIIP